MVGLDPQHAKVVKDIFRERAEQGMTIFLSTHQLSIAEEMADRIGIISRGKFVGVGTADELRNASGTDGALESSFLALTKEEETVQQPEA